MKQMKVLGVIAVALTLGLTACGGTKECKTHKWGEWEVVTAETCTTDGLQKRTCTVCKKVEEKKINKGHKWGSWSTVEESTCTEAGSEKRTCSRCNEVETRPLDLAPHTYEKDAEGNDVIRWTTEPNCTDAGVGGYRTCTVCQQHIDVSSSEAAALGHNYAKDADGKIIFTWTTAPSCELPGVGTKHCDRCGQDIAATDEERAKLGHDVEAIGGEVAPTDGTAAVRLYHCKRCDQTFMGFLANEVTNESKAHVKFEPETVTGDQEQGARFLGRPIGNALALDSNGTSVNQQNGEIVYCSTETGDFIEYAFNLNETQAATLQTCRLYCDAKPADYLNGTDFWAYGSSNDEWTPGYYIDGGPERFQTNDDGTPKMVKDHAKAGFDSQPGAELETEVQIGKRIEDYRYVLYVDGNVVDFDPDTANPTSGRDANMQRGEFELPYTFHLHAGLNKIKFVMAGGYRSLFYKCIFRPYVEPTPVTVNETELTMEIGKTGQITSSMTGLQYASSSNSVATVDETGLVTGKGVGQATITVSKEGNYKPAKVKVTVTEVAGTFQISAEQGVIAPEGGATWYVSQYSAAASRLRNFQKDSTVTFTFDSAVVGNFDVIFNVRHGGTAFNLADFITVKVNGADVDVAGRCESQNAGVDIKIGQAALQATGNTLVITTIAENSPMNLHYIKFAPASATPAHEHTWGNPVDVPANTERGTVAYKKYTCSGCNKVKVEIAISADMIASGSGWANSPATSTGYYKLGTNGNTWSLKFDYDADASAVAYQRGICETSNGNRTYFDVKDNSHKDGNFEMKVNGTAIDLTPMKDVKYSEMLGTAEGSVKNFTNAADCKIGETNLINGVNEVVYKRIDSFNFGISHIFFIVG